MSIRITTDGVTDSGQSGTAGTIPPLLLPQLDTLYSRRIARLQQLAIDHPLTDYLLFSARLVTAQQQMLQTCPLTGPVQPDTQVALDCRQWSRSPYWRQLLHGIVEQLQSESPPGVQQVLHQLQAHSAQQLEQMATLLLSGNSAEAGSGKALFIWAALSLYWAQMASLLPGRAQTEAGEGRQFCPVCHSAPVTSVVHIGAHEGLRYLHCGLCESQWHMVRVKCSNCEQGGQLAYWSLQSEKAAVKAESCGDCHSYLKILYQAQDPQVDALADDLASLILDQKLEQKGFARSAVNPLLFPG